MELLIFIFWTLFDPFTPGYTPLCDLSFKTFTDIIMYELRINISSIFSNNSEVFDSELLDTLEALPGHL